MNELERNWQKFLSAKELKENLISISLFITVFELFKKRIIDMPLEFFSDEFDKDKGWLVNQEKYEQEILSRNKSHLYASLLWFHELGVIVQKDIDKFDEIRRHRNELAHDPFGFISDAEKKVNFENLLNLINLLSKVEKWWFINFEYAIIPNVHKKELKLDEVITPSEWQLKLLFDIASGNEPEENFYFNHFIKNKSR